VTTPAKEIRLGLVTTNEYKERALRKLQDAHNELVKTVNDLQAQLAEQVKKSKEL
jgi:hypothetical protein